MAQTDARAGFRLPWSSERSNIEQTEAEEAERAASDVAGGWPEADTATTGDHPAEPSAEAADSGWEASAGSSDATTDSMSDAPAAAPAPARTPAPRKSSKFLADLTKAMQTAAEDARNNSLTQFQADAKVHVEKIHERSATEANTLRRQADDDVAAVRDWSKTEIARIREETETKITARKGRLETEIEQHSAMIEREIQQVQGRVSAFEDEMAQFFERLLAEEDPTHFATMAENLPEPPPFDEAPALDPVEFAAQIEYETAVAEPLADEAAAAAEAEAEQAAGADETTAVGDDVATEGADAEQATDGEVVIGEAETATEPTAEGGWGTDGDFPTGEAGEGGEVDREAAFAAIQAAAEAAASAEVATDAAARAEAVADIAIEIVGAHEMDDEDPRVSALGLSPDFAAAEAEAASAGDTGEEIAEVSDDALAARLAGLVPGKSEKARDANTKSTQVVVVGLVSVASIASFKRHLGRLPGVQSVGVSSGPDGEFLFAVNHAADVSLRDSIPGLPSFQARVSGSADGVLNVTAHDPESDN